MCQAFANELFLILILPQEKQIGEQGGGGDVLKSEPRILCILVKHPPLSFIPIHFVCAVA